MSSLTDKEVIALLASGASILFEDEGADRLVTRHGDVHREQSNRLANDGWLERFANGGGYRLSDAGLKQYLKSTDELGSGELVPPRST